MRKGTMALALGLAMTAAPAQAQDNAACSAMTGLWLTTIENSANAFASRSLVTLHLDGTLTAVDSAEQKGVQGTGFTSQPGVWRCAGAGKASGRTINFGFAPRESIARSDWTLSHSGQTLSGTIALHIFSGLKGVDPFTTDSKPVDTFRFTAQRVTAP
jgi:hypothetical protein